MSGNSTETDSCKILIIGAGPAGLTASYEFSKKKGYDITILEATNRIGGLCCTVNYKGNRIDIGGHRFFSKSQKITDWWLNILPAQGKPGPDDILMTSLNHEKSSLKNYALEGPDPEKTDDVMLIRKRLSRIFFRRRFLDYPLRLNIKTIKSLGIIRIIRIFFSYIRIKITPINKVQSLEHFFINRFGRELYKTFFRDYTEKVWGVPCSEIKPEWGAQRIKGLSVSKAIGHALFQSFRTKKSLLQQKTETSLIGQFLYPKYGPGQLWEEVAKIVKKRGVNILLKHTVSKIEVANHKAVSILAINENSKEWVFHANHIISTMPLKDLIMAMGNKVPEKISEIAGGLVYRDFITIGLLTNKLLIANNTKIKTPKNLIPDNWIYIQEPDMKIGRLQIFNNWSPYMVSDPEKVWMGLEFFCTEGDLFWTMSDKELSSLAISELENAGIINKNDVLDSTVIRVPKTYPAYFGSYNRFNEIREWTDSIENLWLAGRNGMHRYNNQDHSMLTSMAIVDNIAQKISSKKNIWEINTEEEYHEA